MTTSMTQRVQQLCSCRIKLYAHQKKRTKDLCKRKRQAFVYNAEEEIWHEPYMQSLRREFSDESILCDSKIELPWRDIALPVAGMRIRPEVTLTAERKAEEAEDVDDEAGEVERKDSTGPMPLPWQELLISETLEVARVPGDLESCDCSVEIPWGDLILEKPMEIQPPREEKEACAPDDVEIPWDEILVPRNIVIEPEKKTKHPSSEQPPRARVLCCTSPRCARTRVNNATVSCPLARRLHT
ncbi:uncharacterized protein LOC105188150 [Harpegnathos saltator]|uniref:uncharacterized protein LOC105188150 n=1 Tax=Harpegnathos saltator TaxID=610380 RepID=UPI00058D57C3|nr:uncharacterized protein LOC105188150 [Harpegnathos saltator]